MRHTCAFLWTALPQFYDDRHQYPMSAQTVSAGAGDLARFRAFIRRARASTTCQLEHNAAG